VELKNRNPKITAPGIEKQKTQNNSTWN